MKMFIALFLVLLCLFIAGCETLDPTSTTSNSNTTEETIADKLYSDLKFNLTERKINCYEIFDIKDFGWDQGVSNFENLKFINKHGELFLFSIEKLFYSTNTNCEKVNTNIKFKKFLYNYVVSTDNKLYEYDYTSKTIKQVEIPREIRPYDLSNVFYLCHNLYSGFLRVENNNIYSCQTEELLLELPPNETIEIIADNTIKTNKGWYIITGVVKNEKECKKYLDVQPIYGIEYKQITSENIKFYKSYRGEKYGIAIIENRLFFC